MQQKLTALLFAALVSFTTGGWAGLLDKEIAFSEAQIQTALAKAGPQQKNYGGLMTVSLLDPPQITLGVPEGKVGIIARVHVAVLGQPAIPVDVTATPASLQRHRQAFFLENPVAHSVGRAPAPRIRAGRSQRDQYGDRQLFPEQTRLVLREDAARGSRSPLAAALDPHRTGKVVAVLSPL